MNASNTATHLNYLTDAAHLLAFTAPETSAYLMTQHNGLLLANDLDQSALQRQHVCAACGCIMILGQNSGLKLENEKTALRKKKQRAWRFSKADVPPPSRVKPGPSAGTCKIITCHSCGRYTKISLPAPGRISRKKASVVESKTATETAKPTPSASVSANASSKKRAKNRKAGLQALLNQSQAGSGSLGSGLGLSLSDFMKK